MTFTRYLGMPILLCALLLCFWPMRDARASQADGLTLHASVGPAPDIVSPYINGWAGIAPVGAYVLDSTTNEEIYVGDDVSWLWRVEAMGYLDANQTYQSVWSGEDFGAWFEYGYCWLQDFPSATPDPDPELASEGETWGAAQLSNLCYDIGPPGEWIITVRCYATFSDESYLTSNDVTIAFHVYDDGNVVVWNRTIGDGAWAHYGEIAAGGLASDAHHTPVLARTGQAYGAVYVSLEGGTGVSTNASLIFGSTVIYPGQGAYVNTDSEGQCLGELYSSDVIYDGVTIYAGTAGYAYVGFGWNDCWGDDAWVSYPDQIVLDDNMTQYIQFGLNGIPIADHELHFYVDWLVTEDDYGNPVPHYCDTEDLSDYASFPLPDLATNSEGNTITLHVEDKPELVYIHMTYIDLSVWEWQY